jgi:hypothetical protein
MVYNKSDVCRQIGDWSGKKMRCVTVYRTGWCNADRPVDAYRCPRVLVSLIRSRKLTHPAGYSRPAYRSLLLARPLSHLPSCVSLSHSQRAT